MVPDYDERERPSWTEIDKRRDRSAHRQERTTKRGEPFRDRRAMSKYKAKLEEVFSKEGKLGPEQGQKLKKLREVTDRQEFLVLAREFIEAYGLPDGWEDLEGFLRYDDPEILRETIRRMEGLLGEQSPTRKENFQKDLNLIEMTTRDRDLRKMVTNLLRNLNG